MSRRFILWGIMLFLLNSCSDPFGMTVKKIQGKYFIQEFDETLPAQYYVIEKGVDSGGGVFDGVINKVIWVGNNLFAEVQRLSSSDPSGWYKLDLKSGVVLGPINSKSIRLSKVVSAKDFYQEPKKYFNTE